MNKRLLCEGGSSSLSTYNRTVLEGVLHQTDRTPWVGLVLSAESLNSINTKHKRHLTALSLGILKFPSHCARGSNHNYLFVAEPSTCGPGSSEHFLLTVTGAWGVGRPFWWPEDVCVKNSMAISAASFQFTYGTSLTCRQHEHQLETHHPNVKHILSAGFKEPVEGLKPVFSLLRASTKISEEIKT